MLHIVSFLCNVNIQRNNDVAGFFLVICTVIVSYQIHVYKTHQVDVCYITVTEVKTYELSCISFNNARDIRE